MATTAVSKYRTFVRVSTAAAAGKTITAITKANPAVCTSNTHGLAVGTVVVLSGIVGMTELNGLAAVVTAQDTNTFTLGGIDSSDFTAYASGGTATPQTMTLVENALDFSVTGEAAERFDGTNLVSTKKEYVIGLAGEGSFSLPVDIDATGPGQARLRALRGKDTAVAFSVTRSDGKAFACMGKIENFSHAFPDKHSGSFDGIITGEAAWYA
jgi:hypothetical protein